MATETTDDGLAPDGLRIAISAGPQYEMTDRVRGALEELADAVGADSEVSGFAMPGAMVGAMPGIGDPLGLKICIIKICNGNDESGDSGGDTIPINLPGGGGGLPKLPR